MILIDAKFQKMKHPEGQVAAAYDRYFRDLPKGSIYHDPLRGTSHLGAIGQAHMPAYEAFDEAMREGTSFGGAIEHVRKTLQLSDWTLPVTPLKEVYSQVFTQTPVYGLLPRVSHRLKTVDLDRLTAMGTAKWKAEGGTPDEGEDTYAPYSTTQKYAMTKGKTTGPMQVLGGAIRNVAQWDQGLKFTQVALLIENTIINGNPAANAGDGGVGDALAFKGIRQQITDTADATLDINPGAADDNTVLARADIRKVRKGLWKYGGVGDLGITDGTTFDSFKATLEANYGVNVVNPNPQLQAFGFENYTFDGMTVVKSNVMPDTDGAREFLVVDSRALAMYHSLDMTMEPLAKSGDSDEYMVKSYGVLGIHQDKHLGRVKDLA